MSLFNETQREPAINSEADISAGPRVGFLRAFELSLESQVRTESLYADAAAFDREEYEQNKRIRAAGLEPPPSLPNRGLWGVKQFEQVARYYNQGEDADLVAADLASRNQHIERLQRERPDLNLQTYDQLWSTVKQKAKQAETRWENAETTLMGSVGGFLGTMVGSVNPDTDPLNAITLGVGGVGRTALKRVASEAGAQSAIEAVNQFTGVQGARERLGLDASFGRSAMQVAGVGLGAGAIRGVGELGARWFRNAPNDPAPPVPPPAPRQGPDAPLPPPARLEYPLSHYLGGSRRANTVLDAELASVSRQLDEGVPPWAVKPATSVALPGDVGRGAGIRIPTETVEQLIERADPETWRLYSKLQTKADQLQRAIDDVGAVTEDAAATAALRQLDEQLATLNATAQNAKGKKLEKLQAEMRAIEEQRAPLAEAARAGSPETAARRQSELRQGLMRIDEQMRDLAPVLSRARAAAEEKFQAQFVDPEVAALLRKNNPGSEILQKAKWKEAVPERVDLGPLTFEQRVLVRPGDALGADAEARALAHLVEDAEAMKAQVEALAAMARSTPDDMATVFTADGREIPAGMVLHLEGRELTVREFLREVHADSGLIESAVSCSIVKTL